MIEVNYTVQDGSASGIVTVRRARFEKSLVVVKVGDSLKNVSAVVPLGDLISALTQIQQAK